MDWADCKRWVKDAMADGWELESGDPDKRQVDSEPVIIKLFGGPTFAGGKPWVIHWRGSRLEMWAPDGLVVLVPERYEGQADLFRLLLVCPLCYRQELQVSIMRRWSYAGRCCPTCFDAMPASRRHADPN